VKKVTQSVEKPELTNVNKVEPQACSSTSAADGVHEQGSTTKSNPIQAQVKAEEALKIVT